MKEGFYFSILICLFIFFFFFSILHESIYISIFFLISLFLLSSLIFIISGVEFIGFLYLIVYVGAVAVLFLFMVMLFDRTEYVIFTRTLTEKISDSSINIGLVFVFAYDALILLLYPLGNNDLVNMLFFMNFSYSDFDVAITNEFDNEFNYYYFKDECFFDKICSSDPELFTLQISNVEGIGSLLYDYFFFGILGASLVLLLGMIGSIFLTQSITTTSNILLYRHQNIKDQLLHRSL